MLPGLNLEVTDRISSCWFFGADEGTENAPKRGRSSDLPGLTTVGPAPSGPCVQRLLLPELILPSLDHPTSPIPSYHLLSVLTAIVQR